MKADQPTRRSRAPECRALTQPFYVSSQPTWYGQHIRELKEDKWLMNIPILRFHLAQALDIWNANSLAPFASIGLLLMTAAGSIVRVVVGYHTWAQVAVGAALGSLGGVGWHRFAKAIALPALDSVATQEVLNLLSVLILLSGGFIFYQRDIFKKKSEADRAREQ
mmetsp:Transcript_15940/g.65280  ORF Transcript_15940/g.65280 Transcript_15940/m.65280 type:complete len:165 (-) Transcript_15940:4237-4731(-)